MRKTQKKLLLFPKKYFACGYLEPLKWFLNKYYAGYSFNADWKNQQQGIPMLVKRWILSFLHDDAIIFTHMKNQRPK